MKTKDTVISNFNKLGMQSDEKIEYIFDTEVKHITVERFAYIIEQADEHGLVHLPILESFDNLKELTAYAGHLLSQINKSIKNNTFSPVYGESYDLFGFVIEDDVYDGEDE